jgi:rhodanese-related sulfurtransferase
MRELVLMTLALALVLSQSLAQSLADTETPQQAQADCSKEERFSQVSRSELAQLIQKKNVTVVDVNSEKSYAKQKVPGAIHYGSNKASFAKVLPEKKDALIVAYCGGPSCSAWKEAAQAACELGYTNVRHYKGGIQGWMKGEKPGKSES